MRWSRAGVWQRVFEHLSADSDNEYAMIDATIVSAHQASAGAKGGARADEAIGRGKSGLCSKIHALVDALGNPAAFCLTPAHVHNLAGADFLLPRLDARFGALLADQAYSLPRRLAPKLRK